MNVKYHSRAIRLDEVCQMTGASRATIWRWVKARANFPQPFKLSEAITVWDEREIASWIRSQKDASHG